MRLDSINIYRKSELKLKEVLRYYRTYRREAIKFKALYPDRIRFFDLIIDFPAWYRSLNKQSTTLFNEMPWITFQATKKLQKILKPGMKVFEYGSGGSTLFFANRVSRGVSVEHDPDWFNKVQNILKNKGKTNWQIDLIEPEPAHVTCDDPSDPESYISIGKKFQGLLFKEYVSKIDQYEDKYFDIILIDGRARPSCFRHAIPKIKDNGYIIWDNTDRSHYSRALKSSSDKFILFDYPGASPNIGLFTNTTFLKRINRD